MRARVLWLEGRSWTRAMIGEYCLPKMVEYLDVHRSDTLNLKPKDRELVRVRNATRQGIKRTLAGTLEQTLMMAMLVMLLVQLIC